MRITPKIKTLTNGTHRLRIYRWGFYLLLEAYSTQKGDEGMNEVLDIYLEYGKNKRVPEKTINSIGR